MYSRSRKRGGQKNLKIKKSEKRNCSKSRQDLNNKTCQYSDLFEFFLYLEVVSTWIFCGGDSGKIASS